MTGPGRPLGVVHLTDNFAPSVGGLERAVGTLAAAESRAGHRVAVVTAHLPGTAPYEVSDGVDIHRLPCTLRRVPGAYVDPGRVFFSPVPDPAFIRGFRRVLARHRPDIVHVHGWILYSGLGPALRSGAAVVGNAHDYGLVCALKSLFRAGQTCPGPSLSCASCAVAHYGPKGLPLAVGLRASSPRHRRVDLWIAVSTGVADAGTAVRRADRRAAVVIPSFVPDSVVSAAADRPRPDFVPPGPYLFYAGALGAHKGVDVLLDAHRRLRSRGWDLPLVLAGMPQPGEALDTGDPGVRTVVGVAHDQVMGAWAHATVGVVPSSWPEPFGQVAVECLAAGTPVVVTRTGGLPDIVGDGEHGVVVAPRDPEALARGIEELLLDPARAQRLAAGGPGRAAQFTVSAVVPMFEQAYRTALERRDTDGRRRARAERAGADGRPDGRPGA